MRNFVQPGDFGLPIIAPVALTAGQLVVLGAIVGVASCDAGAGATVALSVEGVFDLQKVPADAMAAGDMAKVTVAANIGTVAVGGTVSIGWIVQAAVAGSTTARVRLTPAP
jgi:predicted RecA/RadA family phage recombinase